MAKEQDQSMEEILQSIKRIIAEEGEPAPSGSDVLELTDLLADDQAPEAPAPSAPALSLDEIMATPVEAAPTPPPPPAKAPAPEPAPEPEAPLASDQTIERSNSALDALKHMPQAPLPPMPSTGLHFRSGTTIEDLVLEALRPMLKDWLDSNLSQMVERLVEKEIRRLSTRY